MTSEEVQAFYPHCISEPYFVNLVDYMTSGPSVALILAKIHPCKFFYYLLLSQFFLNSFLYLITNGNAKKFWRYKSINF